MVLFRLLVELPFIFLANTLRSSLALFLFLHGRLRGFGLNIVCVCSVDDVIIFGGARQPVALRFVLERGTRMDGGVWSVYRGGEGTVRRGIFRQIFLEWM